MAETKTIVKLPWWAKLAIGLAIAAITSSYIWGIALIAAFQKVARQFQDPVQIAHAAHRIADLPDPLPAGYRYLAGIELPAFALDIVTIEHEPDKQLITLLCVSAPDNASAKQVVDENVKNGMNMLVTSARMQEAQPHAALQVAGKEVDYVIGKTQDINGRKAQGLIGCVQLKIANGRKNILIYALQTTNTPYNQQITVDLLNSIKSF